MSGSTGAKHFLLASDFDQTLSFNDSGLVLSEVLGVSGFERKVQGLARSNLVQQGGELAYLIRHDPEFRGVRKDDLVEAGRRVRLKKDISALVSFLDHGVDDYSFSFSVISAAPKEIVQSALDGIVAPDRIYGTEFDYDPESGEVRAIFRVAAGYGKVAVIEELEEKAGSAPHRTIYVGDGSSDVHVMLHVNNRGGSTIAVSKNRHLARIANRIVLSDSAFSIVVPVLDQILQWRPSEIRALFESYGLSLDRWDRSHTDRVTIRDAELPSSDVALEPAS